MKKYIKEAFILLIVALIVSNIVSWYRTKDIKSNNLELLSQYKTINNKKVNELLEKQKPLVLNFWGTWCPVCAQEVYTIDKIAKDKDVVLITVAVNSSNIKKYMKEKGVEFIVIDDRDGSIAKAFGVGVFPTTLFYSKDRKKIIKDSGYLSYPGYIARKKIVE